MNTVIDEKEALSRITRFCSMAEHCRAEIEEKLRKWGLPGDAIKRIINTLEQESYVDEARFSRAFIRDKYRFDKWGKVKIAQTLRLKHIPEAIYIPLMSEVVDQEEYQAILCKLLSAKRRSLHAESDYELNAKLVRYALGRGFEITDIGRCIDLPEENE